MLVAACDGTFRTVIRCTDWRPGGPLRLARQRATEPALTTVRGCSSRAPPAGLAEPREIQGSLRDRCGVAAPGIARPEAPRLAAHVWEARRRPDRAPQLRSQARGSGPSTLVGTAVGDDHLVMAIAPSLRPPRAQAGPSRAQAGPSRAEAAPSRAEAAPSRTAASRRDGPRVVVGVDGSPASERALAWAVHEAVLRGARIEIIHAGDFGPSTNRRSEPAVPLEWAEHVGSLVRTSLARIPEVDLVAELSHVASTEVAARALIEASRGADLLVVGSHDGPYPDHAQGGAVTSQCIRAAHCPVVVVRGKAAATSDSADPADPAEA